MASLDERRPPFVEQHIREIGLADYSQAILVDLAVKAMVIPITGVIVASKMEPAEL